MIAVLALVGLFSFAYISQLPWWTCPLLPTVLPGSRHGQVAAESDGVFQTTVPPALEEHHVPQKEQGDHIFTTQDKKQKIVWFYKEA